MLKKYAISVTIVLFELYFLHWTPSYGNHLKQSSLHRNGSNTKGYFVWSLVDLFEQLGGNQSSYGLYHLDFADKDLKRYPRRSAIWYADFLKGGRGAMSARYSNSELRMSGV